jgi:hypothetical protein
MLCCQLCLSLLNMSVSSKPFASKDSLSEFNTEMLQDFVITLFELSVFVFQISNLPDRTVV